LSLNTTGSTGELDLFTLAGKTALVTGGSRGIGCMIAAGLVAHGVRTFICGRGEAAVAQAAGRLSKCGECHGIVADLATEAGRDAIHHRLESVGALHLLVNNAGITAGGPIEQTDLGRFEKVLSVNLAAPFGLVARLLPLLRKAAAPNDPARIINIASIDAIRVPP
jgi:NAD(P)-dependent dehydrogenase (short-subunit alcohol dehydrogenase family)